MKHVWDVLNDVNWSSIEEEDIENARNPLRAFAIVRASCSNPLLAIKSPWKRRNASLAGSRLVCLLHVWYPMYKASACLSIDKLSKARNQQSPAFLVMTYVWSCHGVSIVPYLPLFLSNAPLEVLTSIAS